MKQDKPAPPPAAATNSVVQASIRQELALSGILLLLSFVLGGMVHKVLRAGDHLTGGDEFFSSTLLVGCIPLLTAAGALLAWRHRAVHNTVWRMTVVAGLSLILMGFGYFEAYTW